MRRPIVLLLGSVGLASAALAGELAKTTLMVERLGCRGCSAAFERQLAKTEGVTAYVVSARKGEADLSYDPDQTDAGEIGESLLKHGFEVRLSPWEPVSASFNGCSNGFCGTRRPHARVHVQPGASPGHHVYCLVSGVVLHIEDSTPRSALDGKPVYVCCQGCLRYLQANRDRVLALRGKRASRVGRANQDACPVRPLCLRGRQPAGNVLPRQRDGGREEVMSGQDSNSSGMSGQERFLLMPAQALDPLLLPQPLAPVSELSPPHEGDRESGARVSGRPAGLMASQPRG